MKDTKDIIAGLNGLLEKNVDAYKGYEQVAEKVDNKTIKHWFKNKTEERSKFKKELISEINQLGGSADKSGSAAGTLHRTWIDIKTLLTADNDNKLLNECIRGEEAFVNEYREFLSNTALPLSTRTVLSEQLNQVIKTKETIANIEETK